jgi:hypothetical protein
MEALPLVKAPSLTINKPFKLSVVGALSSSFLQEEKANTRQNKERINFNFFIFQVCLIYKRISEKLRKETSVYEITHNNNLVANYIPCTLFLRKLFHDSI